MKAPMISASTAFQQFSEVTTFRIPLRFPGSLLQNLTQAGELEKKTLPVTPNAATSDERDCGTFFTSDES